MKRKRKTPFGKISSDFSGFEESLNRMHDDKREYRDLVLSEEVRHEVIQKCLIGIVGTDPKNNKWGFININGQMFEYKGIVGSPYFKELPERISSSKDEWTSYFGYYNYYLGSIELEGRYLNYDVSFGPLASHSSSFVLNEKGERIHSLGGCIS